MSHHKSCWGLEIMMLLFQWDVYSSRFIGPERATESTMPLLEMREGEKREIAKRENGFCVCIMFIWMGSEGLCLS